MNTFQKARLKLTLWYIFIAFFLLTITSYAAIRAEQSALDKILEVIGNKTTRPHLTALFESRITNFEQSFRDRLFIFDGILLLIASGASYFLSGVTLRPIQEMVDLQEEFAADASHELRTPLTTIGMEIEALKRTESRIPQKYSGLLVSVQEEVSRMQGIVDGLLTLVRYTGGKSNQNWKQVDLGGVVKEVTSQMQNIALQKKLTLVLHDEISAHVFGNQDQIKQVMIILLDNAIKYTPEAGTITVATHKKKQGFMVTVSDTGYGIAPEDMQNVFKRFYRGKNTNHMVEKGSGIGLAIAKKIIENHKGTIGVKSQGNGSEFFFTLPKYS